MKRPRSPVAPEPPKAASTNWQAFRAARGGSKPSVPVKLRPGRCEPTAAPLSRPTVAAATSVAGTASFGVFARVPAAPVPPPPPPPPPPASDAEAERRRRLLGPWPDSHELSPEERRYVALDCEMVGVGPGGERSVLALVTAVDWAGRVLYSAHVKPQEPVTDYRTHVSGVEAHHLRAGLPFASVQAAVAALIKGRILVGHGLANDLRVLRLSHAWTDTRDTATYRPLCRKSRGGHQRPRRLKHLVAAHLGLEVQADGGAHDPAEDARAALALYRHFRREWEGSLVHGRPVPAARHAAAAAGGAGGGGASASARGKGKGRREPTAVGSAASPAGPPRRDVGGKHVA